LRSFSGEGDLSVKENNIEQLEFEKQAFLSIFSPELKEKITEVNEFENLIEVVLDLGRKPEERFTNKNVYLREEPVSKEEIENIVLKLGVFDRDNRAGIEKTLHRISAIFNRKNEIVGLTCRVGRAIYGTIEPLKDIIKGDKSILLLGKPGVGKTTLLREAARVLSEEMNKRVIVVDTSNEIGGDGDIPHPGIGNARRMQVPFGKAQEDVMIEAVENHFPEVIIIDEIGRTEEAKACRTIAERGVRLIATAHGTNIENLLVNPTLQDLIGGITAVTLSDEEAIRRGTQKTILERKSPPTFDVLIEIRERGVYAIYYDVADTVDDLLRGFPVNPEIKSIGEKKISGSLAIEAESERPLKIFPLGINTSYLERAVHSVRSSVEIVRDLNNADIILANRKVLERKSDLIDFARKIGVKVETIEKTSLKGFKEYIKKVKDRKIFKSSINYEKLENLIHEVMDQKTSLELPAESDEILQEEQNFVSKFGLKSEIIGLKPNRRIVIYPKKER
jgi:stage III sporulation protein SpoIIIAA